MYELLYTSAPAGLKPGSSGFATVAATRGMPRPLMDRLEALSIYRHTGDSALAALAHWILTVGGREYHVLSRIADAGLDHTQRTNFLAHHLALDAERLPPGGPAWLLSRHLLDPRWDGIVGERPPHPPLPAGDDPPARCTAWADAIGEPGWAGALAEAIAKNPRRPIGLIFSPGTAILPLIRETLALLPPHQRWAATFNTYYTSMPTSATCAWRCCLADTPAAADLRRYAATGLLLDLTRPDRLPALPISPWTIAARDGMAPIDRAAAPRGIAPPLKVAAPPTLAAILSAPPADPLDFEQPQPAHAAADDSIMISRGHAKRPTRLPTGTIPQPPGTATSKPDAKRARQLILLYALACIAIGAGTWLLVAAYNNVNNAPPDIAPPPRHVAIDIDRGGSVTPPPDLTPAPNATPTPAPPIGPNRPTGTPGPVAVAPALPPPRLPKNVLLTRPLVAKTLTGGLTDITQSFSLAPNDFNALFDIRNIGIRFPNGRNVFPINTGNLQGFFKLESDTGTDAVSVQWDGQDAHRALDVMQAALNRDQLTITWRHHIILNRPEIYTTLYWLFGRSTITLSDGTGALPDTIRFPPPESQAIDPLAPASALTYSMPLPAIAGLAPRLPSDWKTTLIPAPPATPAPPPTGDMTPAATPLDGPAIMFERPAPGGVPATFTLTFSRDLSRVGSDLAIQIKALQTQDAQVTQQQTDAQTDLDQRAAGPQGQLDVITPQLATLHQELDLSDEDLDKKGLKRTDLLQQQSNFLDQQSQLQTTLANATKDARAALATIQARHAAITAALAYDEKRPAMSIDFILPGNVTIATLTLSQDAAK